MIKAGENKSIVCPGVSEHSLISTLEWLSLTSRLKLVELVSDTTTVWTNQQRISLLSDSYGLTFHPARAEDSGDYVCLVNSWPKPDAVVRLIVQGEFNKCLFLFFCGEMFRCLQNLLLTWILMKYHRFWWYFLMKYHGFWWNILMKNFDEIS